MDNSLGKGLLQMGGRSFPFIYNKKTIEMKICKTVQEIRDAAAAEKRSGKTIACVPTMGYLHEGHLSLVAKAKEVADVVIVTLFVNPTQFSPNEDFASYPRDFEHDASLCSAAGADYLFAPSEKEMYPAGYQTGVCVKGVSELFEGSFRPIHFNGVATVVAKLFIATKADYAVFGQKDYQQTLVVRQMARDLLLGVKIIVAPIKREESGLARSSRNTYLTAQQKEDATILSKTLKLAEKAIRGGMTSKTEIDKLMKENLEKQGSCVGKIDYASAVMAEDLSSPSEFKKGDKIVLLLAVYVGKVRLIDNMIIEI